MFENAENKILLKEDVLAGEIQEGEVAEVLKDSSAYRTTKMGGSMLDLTFWVPTIFRKWFDRMKRCETSSVRLVS
jgi:chitin synthase